MRPASALTVPAALACAALLAPSHAAVSAVPAQPPPARATLLTVPADLPAELLGQQISASIAVRALVSSEGLVDSARAVSGDERLRSSAEAAVRWWVFAPAEKRGWTAVTVPIAADADAAPLYPDLLAMAREAEANGDFATALAAWVGTLKRVGRSPVATNEWLIREHTMALAHRMSPHPQPSGADVASGQGARAEQLRTVARANHVELVAKFDEVLAAAPWWSEPYLWRAGSLAGCGRAAEALRSLRAYRLASNDSAGIAFAGRMIDRLGAVDTVGVCETIKTWGVASESRTR